LKGSIDVPAGAPWFQEILVLITRSPEKPKKRSLVMLIPPENVVKLDLRKYGTLW
jgi:hypothetical protein